MFADRFGRERVATRLGTCAIAALLFMLASPRATWGQTATAEFCKKLPRENNPLTRDCGTKVTTNDAYVAVLIRLTRIDNDTPLSVELLDPDQAAVWTSRRTITVEAGYYFPDWWMWTVLGVAADAAAVASESVALASVMIRVEGKPVKERLGEWTLRVRVRNGPSQSFKFTLQAP